MNDLLIQYLANRKSDGPKEWSTRLAVVGITMLSAKYGAPEEVSGAIDTLVQWLVGLIFTAIVAIPDRK